MLGRILRSNSLRASSRSLSGIASDFGITKYRGSRIVELLDGDNGNILTKDKNSEIMQRMDTFAENTLVDVVMFAADSPKMFSKGYSGKFDLESLTSAQELTSHIGSFAKPTVAFFSGYVDGSSFATFGLSKFRVGTASSCFQVNEIIENRGLPGAGLSYFLSNCCSDGVEIARYLGLTGACLNVAAMQHLGLISYYVPNHGHHALADALSRTNLLHTEEEEGLTSGIVPESIEDLLYSMDVHDPESFQDFTKSRLWSKYGLVTPDEIFSDANYTHEKDGKVGDLVIEDINNPLFSHRSVVTQCFSCTTLSAIREEVAKVASEHSELTAWSQEVLNKLDSVDPKTANVS